MIQVVSQFKQWLFQAPEQRRAERHHGPGTVAYYWDGSVPVPREIRDISLSGAYLHTPERWYPGTIVKLTLKSNGTGMDARGDSIEVRCRVVRHGPDGVGLQFISQEGNERKGLHKFVMGVIANLRRGKVTDAGNSTAAQSLVEFALTIPLLFVLIAGVVDFGGWIFSWITVAHTARSVAQYAVLGGVWLNYPSAGTSTQLTTVINSETAGLPNRSSVTVAVCEYNNGSLKRTVSGTCSGTAPSDTEPVIPGSTPVYSLRTVDVNYTYQPFIPLFNFSALGISLPAVFANNITVHQRAVMRMVQ